MKLELKPNNLIFKVEMQFNIIACMLISKDKAT